MDGPNLSAEAPKTSLTKSPLRVSSVVFKPQKLKEVVEIIDLMGNISSRVREDSSGDMGGGGTGSGQSGGTQGAQGTSTRDEAIAKAPPVPVMQKKLVQQIHHEVKNLEKQARRLKHSKKPGSAFLLNELYMKIRSLTALAARILHASSDLIKRFYISVFIDRQPFAVSGSTLLGQDAD